MSSARIDCPVALSEVDEAVIRGPYRVRIAAAQVDFGLRLHRGSMVYKESIGRLRSLRERGV